MYIKPCIVLIDETKYWDEELAKQAGKIYGVFLFDANKKVHCCELTPSRELESLEVAILNNETCPEEVRDEIEEQWITSTELISYMHVSTVNELLVFALKTERCKAEDYDGTWEELVDYFRANTPWYTLPDEK
jgi:hypothetical protein